MRADQTDEAVKYNTLQIEGLQKALMFCNNEVVNLKWQNTALKDQCSLLERDVEVLGFKMDDADFHGRRLNLKLHGAPEKGDDNIRAMLKKCAMRRWRDRRLRMLSL